MMLHNQSAVSAPCHMIAVMVDDGLICRKVCVAVDLWWRRNTTDLEPQGGFSSMRRYLMQLEIECFGQTLIASCAGNRESFVRNFYTAKF